MSRYAILVLLNTPLILASLLKSLVAYKLGHIGSRRFAVRTVLWVGIFIGLVFTEPIYRFLFSNHLTQTEPLSLFDVIQITGIIFTFYLANQALTKIDRLERRVQDLHQELSIRVSRSSGDKQ